MTARPIATTATLIAAVLLLAGCTTAPEAEPGSTRTQAATAAPAPTTTPTETAAPEPAPEPEPEPVTCDTILTPEALAALAEQGLEPQDANVDSYPLAQQFAAAGGVACSWARPQTDIRLTAVQLAVLESEQDVWARVLEENGYAPTDDPVPGAWTGPVEPGTGIASAALVEPTRISFVNIPHVLADLAPAP